MADAMGAKVQMKTPSHSLYFISGNTSVDRLVQQVNGHVHFRISPTKLIALLSFDSFMTLSNTPQITRIGPVNIDMERLQKFAKSLNI